MDLKSLYREVILDHYKNPRNHTELSEFNRAGACKNPSCGDKISVQLNLSGAELRDVGFIGNGCAISQASASMMTKAIKGRSLEEVRSIMAAFRAMIVDRQENPDTSALGELISMHGIAKLHARVKCAMCGWSAVEAALERQATEVDLDLDDSMPDSSAGAAPV